MLVFASLRAGIVLTLWAVLALAAGCGGSADGSDGKTVVAAFYPIAYAAQRVDPDAEVENLTPAGAEPHDLELSARDVERVLDADTVLYFGVGFMPALEQAVEGRDNAVDLLAGQRLVKGAAGEETVLDPHAWLAPMRYAALGRKVAEALDEPGAGADLIADLKGLDAEFRRGLAHCERHQIVTSHAAFGYLAKAYGLEQIPLTGISPEAEPSAKALEALVDKAKRDGATTVFFETLVSPKLAQTVAREAGAKTARARPNRGPDEGGDRQGWRLLLGHARESCRPAQGARMQVGSAAVELQHVSFAYGHGTTVLRDVDLRIEQGEFVAIAGPNRRWQDHPDSARARPGTAARRTSTALRRAR